MGQPDRPAGGGEIFHVLNRASSRVTLFEDDEDYAAFERVLAEAVERTNMRLLAYCLMPNHWHVVLWPREDGDLSGFTGWLTLTHTRRWHAHRHSTGSGHVYQGRFKSFPVQDDGHVETVCRYVERNPLRANLVARAEEWRWSSLHRRIHATADEDAMLSEWPIERRPDWVEHVNEPMNAAELEALRLSSRRGRPFGDETWSERVVRRLSLQSTLRPRGRPRKVGKGS
jgi:putative transposase